MNRKSTEYLHNNDYLGCFGNLTIEDKICKKYCALRIKCAIEKNNNAKMEILEDLIAFEEVSGKFQ